MNIARRRTSLIVLEVCASLIEHNGFAGLLAGHLFFKDESSSSTRSRLFIHSRSSFQGECNEVDCLDNWILPVHIVNQ